MGHSKVFLRQIYSNIQDAQRCCMICMFCMCGAGSRMVQGSGESGGSWYQGEFKPPIRVHDDRSLLEAQLWSHALQETEIERSSE